MDFGKAGLLVVVVLILTHMVKMTFPTMPVRLTPIVAALIGIGAVFLTSETIWSNENNVGGHSLEQLDFWSKLVVGIILGAGGAGALHETLKAVHNIGENKDDGGPA